MKKEAIEAMLSDPRVDPTTWVGKALLKWINSNPTECLTNDVAREYLLQGMESNDTQPIANGIIDLYKETKNPSLIREYVNGFNLVKDIASWHASQVGSKLYEIADLNILNDIVRLKVHEDSSEPPIQVLNMLNFHHVQNLIDNRKPRWDPHTWHRIVDVIPRENLFEYFTTKVWPCIDVINTKDSAPKDLQNIMWYVFKKLPATSAWGWWQFLTKTQVQKVWWDKKDLFKKGDDVLYKVTLNETVCRCGYVSTSTPGYTLHRKSCDNHGINLALAAKILVARTTNSLMCGKCGKTCGSQPGYTLHRKGCDSLAGAQVMEERAK